MSNAYGVFLNWANWNGDEPVGLPFGDLRCNVEYWVDTTNHRIFFGTDIRGRTPSVLARDVAIVGNRYPNADYHNVNFEEFDYNLDYFGDV